MSNNNSIQKEITKNEQTFERRFIDQDHELRAEAESRTISGYAAVFNKLSRNLGWFREKIEPGAFDDVLSDDVYALFNHDTNKVLARTTNNSLKLSIDETGLKYEFDAPATTTGDEILENIRSGLISASSFGFTIEKDRWIEDEEIGEIRVIEKIKRLYDVSPVTFPAYPDTSVAKRSHEANNPENTEEEKNFSAYKIRKNKISISKMK